jgi:hypothetical protein
MPKYSKGQLMRTAFATIITAALFGSAAIVLAAPVIASPAGPSSVETTVNGLKADGYDVILNRTGAAPLSQCTVSAVRPGHNVTRTDSGNPGDALATTVVSKTVYVDVAC